MSVSNIGNINYINQNQNYTSENQARLNAKILQDTATTITPNETLIINESAKSSETKTNLDDSKQQNEQKSKKHSNFSAIINSAQEEKEKKSSDKLFDKTI